MPPALESGTAVLSGPDYDGRIRQQCHVSVAEREVLWRHRMTGRELGDEELLASDAPLQFTVLIRVAPVEGSGDHRKGLSSRGDSRFVRGSVYPCRQATHHHGYTPPASEKEVTIAGQKQLRWGVFRLDVVQSADDFRRCDRN